MTAQEAAAVAGPVTIEAALAALQEACHAARNATEAARGAAHLAILAIDNAPHGSEARRQAGIVYRAACRAHKRAQAHEDKVCRAYFDAGRRRRLAAMCGKF